MATKGQSINIPSTNKCDRRRGRPAGKNRVPLSLEERRSRNALYEKERRNETTDAMAELAEAVGCDSQITNPELLVTVISRLQSASVSENIKDIKRINDNLERQISILQSRIDADPAMRENLNKDLDDSFSSEKSNIEDHSESSSCLPESESSSSVSERSRSVSERSSSVSESSSREDTRPTKYFKTREDSTIHDVNPAANCENDNNVDKYLEFSFMSLFAERETEMMEGAVCGGLSFISFDDNHDGLDSVKSRLTN